MQFELLQIFTIILVIISFVSSAVIDRTSLSGRVKRQWGGNQWQQGGNQFNRYGNRENINARNNRYNCQTEGIDILGLPISEYECQTSGSSSQINAQNSGFQQNGFQQGGFQQNGGGGFGRGGGGFGQGGLIQEEIRELVQDFGRK